MQKTLKTNRMYVPDGSIQYTIRASMCKGHTSLPQPPPHFPLTYKYIHPQLRGSLLCLAMNQQSMLQSGHIPKTSLKKNI